MNFDLNSLKAISVYLDDPTEQRSIYGLSSLYWSTVIDNICELIHNEGDVDQFLKTEYDFINSGIIDKIVENADEIRSQINNDIVQYNHISIQVVTEWFKDIIIKINSGDKRELLERDIKNLEIQQSKIDNEIAYLQKMRREFFVSELSANSNETIISQIDELVGTDFLTFQNMQTKKTISKGFFFSVDDRREFVNRTNQLQREIAKNEALFSLVKSSEKKITLRKYNTQINKLFEKNINCGDTIAKKEKALDEIEKDQSSISVIEVENRVRTELKYLRDMVKLSAKRLHMESCPILRPGDNFFTIKEMCSCFDRILEFDPRVFHNDRVTIFGKPSAILVPGNGKGLYDWSNNQFIIPMVPPSGDFMASVATAIIEYRLDVDEEKTLLTSYQKLPDLKDIKSLFALRTNLTKDYIKWMTSEYMGFKVLSKESRKWFEHEIAPSKNDIFCPPQYQPFALSSEEFQNLLKAIESKLAKDTSNLTKKGLWTASILYYQQGKFKESFKYINELLTAYPDHIFGYYNLGIIGMKILQKQDAIKGFQKFIKKNPRSWWASVATEHVRRLKIG